MSFHLVLPIVGSGLLGSGILITFYVLTILILWSYYEAMFTEPGIVSMEIVPLFSSLSLSARTHRKGGSSGANVSSMQVMSGRKCDVDAVTVLNPFGPTTAVDAKSVSSRWTTTARLIVPRVWPSWISNCVGARNQKPFMLFLLYVGLAEGMAIVMTIKYCIHYKRRFQVMAAVGFNVAILPLDSDGVYIWRACKPSEGSCFYATMAHLLSSLRESFEYPDFCVHSDDLFCHLLCVLFCSPLRSAEECVVWPNVHRRIQWTRVRKERVVLRLSRGNHGRTLLSQLVPSLSRKEHWSGHSVTQHRSCSGRGLSWKERLTCLFETINTN